MKLVSIWTRQFWRATAERAVKTAGQSALATYGADVVNVLSTDWRGVLGMAAGGAVLSVFTSLASSRVGAGGGPSVGQEILPAAAPDVVAAVPVVDVYEAPAVSRAETK